MIENACPLKLRPVLSVQEMLQWEQSQLKGDLEQAAIWMDRAALGMARWFLHPAFESSRVNRCLPTHHSTDLNRETPACLKDEFSLTPTVNPLLESEKSSSWRYTLILCGPGGNGGDGWALARRLKQAGWDPLVAYMAPNHPLTEQQAKLAQQEGVRSLTLESFLSSPLYQQASKQSSSYAESSDQSSSCRHPSYRHPFSRQACAERFDLIIDALLGIGAHGPISGQIKAAIEWANAYVGEKILKVALDCSSGWHIGPAFHSDHTLCVQYLKKECLFSNVLKDAGRLHMIDLYLENLGIEDPPSSWKILDPSSSYTPPAPSRIENKYSKGVVYLIAGSAAYPGSATLSEQGAWMAKPGMVYTSSPPKLEPSVYLHEVPSQLRSGSVLAIGPGMDPTTDGLKLLQAYLERSSATSARVLDAGALFHLSQEPSLWSLLQQSTSLTLLTPHEGELDRLLKAENQAYSPSISTEKKMALAQDLCKKHAIYLLFKGPISYLLGTQDDILIEPFATPCLAQGGSGDFLSGLIASYLSRRPTLESIAYALRAQAMIS